MCRAAPGGRRRRRSARRRRAGGASSTRRERAPDHRRSSGLRLPVGGGAHRAPGSSGSPCSGRGSTTAPRGSRPRSGSGSRASSASRASGSPACRTRTAAPWWSENACCSGLQRVRRSRQTLDRRGPRRPSACTANTRHDAHRLAVDAARCRRRRSRARSRGACRCRPRSWRSTSASVRRGSTATSWRAPLTVSVDQVDLASSSLRSLPCARRRAAPRARRRA